MIGVLFYIFFNLLFFSYIFRKTLKKIESFELVFSLVNFLAFFISTVVIFLIACLLSPFTQELLKKSVFIYSITLVLFLIFKKKDLVKFLSFSKKSFFQIFFFTLIFILFFLFFSRHLTIKNNQIYTSYIYWDFHWHAQQIQNFSFGDNFPPQNESLAGLPSFYHFFWAIIPSIFQILGGDLAFSLNFYSAYFFSLIIFAAIGLIKEFFLKNKNCDYFLYSATFLFLISHGSLKIFDHLKSFNLSLFLKKPYLFDFNSNGLFGYNGNMFNIFYFLEERQLIFACLGLLIFCWVVLNLSEISQKEILIFGFIFGSFTLWHLHFQIIFLAVTFSLFLLEFFLKKDLTKTFLFLISLIFFFTLTGYLPIKISSLNLYVNQKILKTYPRINYFFPTMYPSYNFSFKNAFFYYLYGYGLRLPLYFYLFYYTSKKSKKIFLLLLSFFSVFLLINTIQLSPTSIYDNHKWLKPFNLLMDVFALGTLFSSFVENNQINLFKIISISIILIITSLSGFLAFASFFFQKPNKFYASFNNPEYQLIQKTPKNSVFLTTDNKLVYLAGRKTFFSKTLGGYDLVYNLRERKKVQERIKTLRDKKEICQFLIANKLISQIDYVFIPKKIFLKSRDCYQLN